MIEGSVLFDINTLVDLFNGRNKAKLAIETWSPQNAISFITQIEVTMGVEKYHQKAHTHVALGVFSMTSISQGIVERGVGARQGHGMKLSGAIILAAAQTHRPTLATRNTKDFVDISDMVTSYTL